MHCYKAYLLGYAKSRSMLTSQTRRNVHFVKFLEKCRELTENPLTMEIGNLLIEPTQRIAKYPLLFKGNKIFGERDYMSREQQDRRSLNTNDLLFFLRIRQRSSQLCPQDHLRLTG